MHPIDVKDDAAMDIFGPNGYVDPFHSPRRFAGALEVQHGIALRPHADDLTSVRIDSDIVRVRPI